MKARIQKNAIIDHDCRVLQWPTCFPPRSEYKEVPYKTEATDPDMVFDITEKKNEYGVSSYECTAEGYGSKENYGNGSIYVWELSDLQVVEDTNE